MQKCCVTSNCNICTLLYREKQKNTVTPKGRKVLGGRTLSRWRRRNIKDVNVKICLFIQTIRLLGLSEEVIQGGSD